MPSVTQIISGLVAVGLVGLAGATFIRGVNQTALFPILVGVSVLATVLIVYNLITFKAPAAPTIAHNVIVETPKGPVVVTQEIPASSIVVNPATNQETLVTPPVVDDVITPIPKEALQGGEAALNEWLTANDFSLSTKVVQTLPPRPVRLESLPPPLKTRTVQADPIPIPLSQPYMRPPARQVPSQQVPSQQTPSPQVEPIPRPRPRPTQPKPTPTAVTSPSSSSSTGSKYSADEAAQMITAHNTRRAKKGTPPLTWDPTIAAFAQDWADNLKARDIPLEHRDPNKYGENLAWDSGMNMSPDAVLNGWVEEEEPFYNEATGQCEGGVCGHLTQSLWRTTTHVGCGIAKGNNQQWVVCNYNPKGNWRGEKAY